jgi:hypothetical protein
MPHQSDPEATSEATFAANVYPKGVINPLAVVRRAGPLVALSDLDPRRKKKRGLVNGVDTSLRKAVTYPSSGMGSGYHGPARMASIYPYVSG